MATRNATLIIKNNANSNAPFSGASLLAGEAIVNTASGVMMFSGVTSGTNDWVPAGLGGNANFFEVGSNLYDLKIRNRIKEYNGVSDLTGKFLSGTSDGFVLSNISDISGIDTFVTGGTFNQLSNNITFTKNNGATFDVLTLASPISGYYEPAGSAIVMNNSDNSTFNIYIPEEIHVESGAYNPSTGTITFTNNNSTTFDVTDINIPVAFNNATYNSGTLQFTNTDTTTFDVYGFIDGGAYESSTGVLTFTSNSTPMFDISGLNNNPNTFVTDFYYSKTLNKLTITQNNGEPNLDIIIDTFSGLSITDLTTDRLVYTTTDGKLKTGSASFNGVDMVLPSNGKLTVGSGGLVVGSGGAANVSGTGDLVVNGNLIVYGDSVSAFTSQLYVEDNNITLNYNPENDTISSSIGAGFSIQDGNGIASGDISLVVNSMNMLTGIDSLTTPNLAEYDSNIGYKNRGFITEVNDIVIRSTNTTIPNGVRLLAEFDILDGGTY